MLPGQLSSPKTHVVFLLPVPASALVLLIVVLARYVAVVDKCWVQCKRNWFSAPGKKVLVGLLGKQNDRHLIRTGRSKGFSRGRSLLFCTGSTPCEDRGEKPKDKTIGWSPLRVIFLFLWFGALEHQPTQDHWPNKNHQAERRTGNRFRAENAKVTKLCTERKHTNTGDL